MPFVAPATWTNRSRRVAGSFQVRLRQATGIPRPRNGTNGRRARRTRTRGRRPARVADRPRSRVVGEEALPARDVAGQRGTRARAARRRRCRWWCASLSGPTGRVPRSTSVDQPTGRRSAARDPCRVSVEPSDLVAQLAAGDRARYRMPTAVDAVPARRLVRLDDIRSRRRRGRRSGRQPRLLGELAEHAAHRRPRRTRGRRPGSVHARRRGRPAEAAQQDPLVRLAPRVGREAGPLDDAAGRRGIGRHGPRSPARNRGSRARDAGTRSPITRPIVARTAARLARRRAACSNSGGRPRNAWTSQRDDVLAS